ncbi:MAG: HAMP domain-containing protein, partial [Clostridia bacterium]|nr:HAMP domain-containing protein [Clostridia bacterium]
MAEKPRVKTKLFQFFWACVITLIVAGVMALTVLLLYLLGVTRPETAVALGCAAMTVSVAGAIVSMVMSRILLAPVARLSDASRQIARGDFDLTVEYSGSIEEIRTTYESFNTMARELGAIETLRKDFIANVSHEFKTPLTAIEGYAMLLQDTEGDLARQREYVDKILFNTRRLGDLV